MSTACGCGRRSQAYKHGTPRTQLNYVKRKHSLSRCNAILRPTNSKSRVKTRGESALKFKLGLDSVKTRNI